ncbi:DUF92 domain-containing protein [Acanthopleuribacter pedis]|uniref:DUF92 domain-containing protein n=1 Tax=Acanthopleuribacter pedis TaxID=442870 RepID=A0A8J7QK79_9BACT|nr:DUF92 domain-containing protein [Acanthopleuribacter pedis]MBO1322496.1 DUF92 domain-containing protein [Acanthopleuribacter pedis]
MRSQPSPYRGLYRRLVHISMVGFALCIGRLPPWLITVLCVAAFVFNWKILPLVSRHMLERPEDRRRGFSIGMLCYPAILLVLSLVFYENQVFMAVGWGAMAFGDGFAGLIGEKLGGPRIPWNPHKSISGLTAFVLLGTPATWLLIMGLPEASRLGADSATWLLWLAPALVVAAAFESARGTIDDNLVVPTAAACTVFALSQVQALPPLPGGWWLGVGLAGALAFASIATRKMDLPGGIAGFVIAALLYLGAGPAGFTALFAFFVLAVGASKWKFAEKTQLGVAQEDGGKRSVRHAVSNGAVAATAATLALLLPQHAAVFTVAAAGALASATADTLSSELGNVYGRRYLDVVTFTSGQRGDDGVVSLEGTLLGLIGAVVIAAVAFWGGAGLWGAAAVVLGGAVGNLADSILGATFQRKDLMTNDSVNFANTLIGAVVTGSLVAFVG